MAAAAERKAMQMPESFAKLQRAEGQDATDAVSFGRQIAAERAGVVAAEVTTPMQPVTQEAWSQLRAFHGLEIGPIRRHHRIRLAFSEVYFQKYAIEVVEVIE